VVKLHRRAIKYSPLCPGCREEPKTHTHYIQCPAASRIQWRIGLLTTLQQQMVKTSTNGELQDTIINCLDSAMAHRPIHTHGTFHRALTAQAQIGWVHMLQGYWSLEWQAAYDNTYPVPDEETRQEKQQRLLKMTRWQKKIIRTVWGSMIKFWKLRNDERHGWDKESRNSARREVLHKELEAIYERKHEYPQ
jgi:hypothetical protein